MRLLTGPGGAGKTFQVVEEFRAALRRRDGGARLLAPTATMAQHLQNQVAREGLVVRPSMIQTLSRFVDRWADERPQVSEPLLYLLVETAARRVDRPEFSRVVRLPGFCAALARGIEEFSSAGCGAARLARHLPAAPLAQAFLAVYEEVERELARRGLARRAERLEQAAARIEREGLDGIHTVWLDGFHALPEPEFAVIEAMARHAGVVLTLPSAPATQATRERLLALGFREERCLQRDAGPQRVLVEAASVEREADEIARRILEQAARGREFREIGIVVRNPQSYEPVLRAALERFGIPARFYFEAPLADHPMARFLAGVVDALVSGWDWAAVLALARLAPDFSSSVAMEHFDFAVRERLPGSGLAALREIAGEDPAVAGLLERLGQLEAWRGAARLPEEWAAELRRLRGLVPSTRPGSPATHEEAARRRGQAAALDAFEAALDEAGLDRGRAVPLAEFWREVKSVLRLTPLRIADARRNVVHVLGAHEARQWRLPVILVCGLVEKQFPRFHAAEPFFPEAARQHLNRAGIRVRTAADLEIEERFLFESAAGRTSDLLVLSYPRSDARGERNLPSIYLDELGLTPVAAPVVRPASTPRPAAPRGPLRCAELLRTVEQQTARVSPTALEFYQQCPFQYFSRRTLRLQEPPPAPEKRLDPQAEGGIIHAVLAELYRGNQPLEPVFERVFRDFCDRERIPRSYRVEARRQRLLEDLRRFVAERGRPPAAEVRVEENFVFELEPGLRISGRIDRLDVAEDGRAVVVDYKYSNAQKTKARLENPNLLQPPLYLLGVERALGLRAAGFFYCGLRGGVQLSGWEEPIDAGWLEQAAARSRQAVAEIRAGEIAARPADPTLCAWCEARDVCRYRGGTAALAEEA